MNTNAVQLDDNWQADKPAPSSPLVMVPTRILCACGEDITPERGSESWIYYCQDCGADWTVPAPRKKPSRKVVTQAAKCQCGKRCRFCGKGR